MKVVDNFLYDSLYNNIKDRLDSLSYRLVDKHKGSRKFEASLDAETQGSIKDCYFQKVGDLVGYFDASVVRCEPGYRYNIHADHPNKLVSTVVYLCPEKGNGTLFLKNQEGNTRTFHEVIWFPNRLVSWVNSGQEHMYENTTNDVRYTLNIYQKKDSSGFFVEPINE